MRNEDCLHWHKNKKRVLIARFLHILVFSYMLFRFVNVFFNGRKTFGAQHMFDSACVRKGCFPVNPKLHQPIGKNRVAFVNLLRDFPSGFGQSNMPVFINLNVPGSSQIFHGYADAWLGKAHFIGNINGAHIGMSLTQHQNGFQVIFSSLLYFHKNCTPCLPFSIT